MSNFYDNPLRISYAFGGVDISGANIGAIARPVGKSKCKIVDIIVSVKTDFNVVGRKITLGHYNDTDRVGVYTMRRGYVGECVSFDNNDAPVYADDIVKAGFIDWNIVGDQSDNFKLEYLEFRLEGAAATGEGDITVVMDWW